MERPTIIDAAEPVATTDDRIMETRRTYTPWSPVQIVAVLGAVLSLALGGFILGDTGIDFSNVYSTTTIAGIDGTMLFGMITFVFGLVLLGVAAVPGTSRVGMITLGVIAVGFGILVAADPTTFQHALGVTTSTGWLAIVGGGVLLLAAMVSPVTMAAVSRSSRRHRIPN